jgi:hypothetical protein
MRPETVHRERQLKVELEKELASIETEIRRLEKAMTETDEGGTTFGDLDGCTRSCESSFCRFVGNNQKTMPFIDILSRGIAMMGVSGFMAWHESGGCVRCNPNIKCDESHTSCIEDRAEENRKCARDRESALTKSLQEARDSKLLVEQRLSLAVRRLKI